MSPLSDDDLRGFMAIFEPYGVTMTFDEHAVTIGQKHTVTFKRNADLTPKLWEVLDGLTELDNLKRFRTWEIERGQTDGNSNSERSPVDG